MSDEETEFRNKLIAAMVGHTLVDISKALSDALGAILAEADMSVRGLLVEEMCARLTRKAMEAKKDITP